MHRSYLIVGDDLDITTVPAGSNIDKPIPELDKYNVKVRNQHAVVTHN